MPASFIHLYSPHPNPLPEGEGAKGCATRWPVATYISCPRRRINVFTKTSPAPNPRLHHFPRPQLIRRTHHQPVTGSNPRENFNLPPQIAPKFYGAEFDAVVLVEDDLGAFGVDEEEGGGDDEGGGGIGEFEANFCVGAGEEGAAGLG